MYSRSSSVKKRNIFEKGEKASESLKSQEIFLEQYGTTLQGEIIEKT